jgi:hypothetical protein
MIAALTWLSRAVLGETYRSFDCEFIGVLTAAVRLLPENFRLLPTFLLL